MQETKNLNGNIKYNKHCSCAAKINFNYKEKTFLQKGHELPFKIILFSLQIEETNKCLLYSNT